MLAPAEADAFARAWVEAWNRRDLEAILAHSSHNHRGEDVVEVMELDARGRVRRGAVHYR